MPNAEPKSDTPKRKTRLIVSSRLLPSPPKLRHKDVELEEWLTESGEIPVFRVCEMSAAEYAECVDAAWVYKDNMRFKVNEVDSDFRLLSFVLRDDGGTRLWHNIADVKAYFGKAGRSTVALLVQAANEMNTPKRGNSDETPSDS